eukprot:360831-Chlamydomonas_euryale.AAC.5
MAGVEGVALIQLGRGTVGAFVNLLGSKLANELVGLLLEQATYGGCGVWTWQVWRVRPVCKGGSEQTHRAGLSRHGHRGLTDKTAAAVLSQRCCKGFFTHGVLAREERCKGLLPKGCCLRRGAGKGCRARGAV